MSGYSSLTGRERSRWPPLTRMLMSGEMSDEKPRDLYLKEKIDRWMVNEGYRRLYFYLRALMVIGYANSLQICSSFLNIAYYGVRFWHDEL